MANPKPIPDPPKYYTYFIDYYDRENLQDGLVKHAIDGWRAVHFHYEGAGWQMIIFEREVRE
jgi:hypothetical protein